MRLRKSHKWGQYIVTMLLLFGSFTLTGCGCQEEGIIAEPPKLVATPPNLIFGAISVGNTINKSLALKNIGGQELTITELKVVNETSSPAFFLLTKKEFPLKLAPDSAIKLTIRYAPKRAGSARGHLRVVSDADNADSDGIIKIPLRSNQLNADLSATPNPVDFGITKPAEDKVKTLTIQNRGQADLLISGMEFKSNVAGEFKLVNPPSYPKTIPPEKSITVDIQYNPSKNVADEVLIIKNNTSKPNYPVRLVGQRAAPDIEVTPVKLLFNDVFLGTKGKKSFTIKNKGTLPLVVASVQFDASTSKDFDMPTPPQPHLTIEPGKSVEIEVQYHSRDINDDKGLIKIASNDPDTPEAKVLLEAKAKGCQMVAIPNQLHYTRPDQKKVNIVNKGNLPCTYKGAVFSPTTSKEFSFALPPPSAKKLLPGQFLEFTIQFKPQDGNDDVGELWIDSDDPDEPKLIVKLTSKLSAAQACQIKLSPTSLNFGFVGIGRSRKQSLSVSNDGYGDCIISAANITPNPQNAFVLLTKLPTGGLTIPSNAKIEIHVAYTPPNAGTHAGVLLLKSNDQKTPEAKVNLNGTSGKLCIEALPDPLDFGSVKVNCSSQKEKMELFNVCSSSASITSIQFGANTNKTKQEFFLKSVPTLPRTLAFGQSFQILLSYVPRDLGVDLGTLEIANSLPGQSPIVITLRGEGVNTDTQKDVFKQLKKPEIDILFIIDDSCSMSNDQTSLANNATSFINWAAQLQVDYHIGVTTTDAGKKGCLQGRVKIVTPQTPNLVNEFKYNAVRGIRGSAYEQGLMTSHMALTNPSLTGCNQGFYRQNAALSLIYVSDEPDQSKQTTSFYINFFKNLKGFRNPDKIRASSIAPTTTGRYATVAKALRGITTTIGNTNWGQTLSQLGAVTFGYRTQFFLSRPADATTIKVKVNGVVVNQSSSNGWVYDATSNSVNFGKGAVPPAGALIEITYRAVCLPP